MARYIQRNMNPSPLLTRALDGAARIAAVLVMTASVHAVSPGSAAAADNGSDTSIGNYLAARQAERQRDHGSAARFLERALSQEPGNFDLLQRTHAALVAEGRFAEAVIAARRIVETSPANPGANLTLAVEAVRNAHWDEAAQLLAEIPLQGINRLVMPLLRAWIAAGRGDIDAVNRLKPLADVADLKTIVDFHTALVLDLVGRTDEAEAVFARFVAPGGRAPLRVIEAAVTFYASKGRAAEARAVLEAARGSFPDSLSLEAVSAAVAGPPPPAFIATAQAGVAAALLDVATAVRGEGDGSLSLPFGRYALALASNHPSMLLLVGDILDQQRQLEEANGYFARIPENSAVSWSARLRMAENLNQLGKTPEAITLLETMAEQRTDRIDALMTLGGLKRVQDKFAEAAVVYDRAVARLGTPDPRHWGLFYARAITLERSKQWPRAEADFFKALELQPEQPDVMNYLAYSWVDQGQTQYFDRALKMLERAVELRPNSGHIIDSLAWALYRVGRFADSVPLLERAVEALSQESVILDHLGDAYWRVGRIAEARYQWRRALETKPEPDAKLELEKKLVDGLPPVTEQKRGG